MHSRWIRAAGVLAVSAAFASAPAHAFDTVDTLPWPSAGRFLAYPGDPIPPWSVFAYGGTMYDTNVRRVSSAETSDLITRVGLGGRYTARVIGRQTVAVDGYGEYRKYADLSQFDHFAYGLRGQWLWELGNQLAGVATLGRTKRLADLGETSNRKDLITEDRADVTGAYRFHPEWRLTGGVGGTRVAHEGRSVATTYSSGARAGIEYVSGLGNTIGLEYRHARGEVPVDEAFGFGEFSDKYDENEVAATLTYALGEQLRVRGRLGQTERHYETLTGADFNGTTGRGAIDWLPSPKFALTLELFRVSDPLIDTTALYVDRRGTTFGGAWAITYKLVATARWTRERRLYRGDPLVVLGEPQRDEFLRTIRLGLGWEPQRHWQVGTALDFGSRTSNLFARDYDYTAVTLNARFQF